MRATAPFFLSHVEELSVEQQTRLMAFLQWLDNQQARRIPDAVPRQVFFSSSLPLRRRVLWFSRRPLPPAHRHSFRYPSAARTPR
jgi:hypothetical protein